ncbi:MAG: O-antigen ligase family protein [Candidatus Goldiibacteriota bacterium]
MRKIYEIFFIAAVFLLPLVFYGGAENPFWAAEKFMLQFSAAVLVLFYAFSVLMKTDIPFKKSPVDIPVVLFLFWGAAGILKVRNIHVFSDKLFSIAAVFLFYFAAYSYFRERPDKKDRIVNTAVFSAFLMALYGIFQSAGMDFISWETDFSGRAASTLGNPNFLAGHLLLFIPIAFAGLLSAKDFSGKAVWSGVFLVMIYALVLTQTRGAYLGFVFSGVVFSLMALKNNPAAIKKSKKTIAFVLAVLAFFSVFYGLNNPETGSRIYNVIRMKDDSAVIRLKLWENTMHIIKDNPVLGTGAGGFPAVYSYYQSKSLDPALFKKAEFYQSGHAHNDYLQLAAEYGLPGAGLFLLIVFVIMRINAGGGLRICGIKAGFAGILLHAFFNFPFLILPTAALFFVLAAYLLSENKKQAPAVLKRLPQPAAAVILPVCIAAAAISAGSLAAESYIRKAKENIYFKKTNAAAEYAERALDINSGDFNHHIIRADTMSLLGRGVQAHKSYKKALELNPGSWTAASEVFRYDLAADDYKQAEKTAEKIYKMSPYSKGAVTSYGYALYLNGKYEEAVNIYEEGMRYFPRDYDLLYHLSAVYGAMGMTRLAEDYARRAVEIYPDNAGARYNLAVAVYKRGKMEQAKEILEKAVEKFPDDQRLSELKKAVENAGEK